MKAVVATRYGKTEDVVEMRDMPAPKPGPCDVLIQVHAASVNPIDFKIQQGALKRVRKLAFPFIMGFDVSGVVIGVGEGVRRFKVGDSVFSRVDTTHMGTFAELVVVDEQYVAAKPATISHQEAAALPLVALTSWQAMFDHAGLKAGQKILIHAGAGGIGTVAIQIAKQMGAYVATTTSTGNVEMVKALGADEVVDYKKQRFDEVLENFDLVFETLGGENQQRSFKVLKRGGRLVSIVGLPKPAWAKTQGLPFFMSWLLKFANRSNERLAREHGVSWDMVLMEANGAQLESLAQLVAEGSLRPVIDRVFTLDQARDALLYSQAGRARGKVVIAVRD